jgi:Cd2+/Zn2+-exporting ATPase
MLKSFFFSDKLMSSGLWVLAIGLLSEYLLGFHGSSYIYILAYLLIGHDILRNTFQNLRRGQVFDENFLMVIASCGAFALGYFTEAVAVILFYKVGEFFQMQASDKATRSIQSMLDIRPEVANVIEEGVVLRKTPKMCQ